MEIRFGVQSAEHQSKPVSAQRMINCYLETAPIAAKTQAIVISSYGIAEFNDISEMQGAGYIANTLYVVGDGGLYSINESGVESLLTGFAHSGQVQVLGDVLGNVVLLIGETGRGYVWNGASLAEITDAEFPDAPWMGLLNSFYIAIDRGTGYMYSSTSSNDPTGWLALDSDNADSSPDNLIWGLIDKKEAIMFGTESTEFWYYSGGTTFPFSPVPNGYFDIGIMSEHAAGRISNAVFFMGNDGIVYQVNGYNPQRISNHAIEQDIEGWGRSCKCFTWTESGHAVVGFKFAEGMIVYDLSTQLWHKRETYLKKTWDIDFVVNAYGRHFTGGETLGELTPDLFTEYGDTLRALCSSSAVYDKNNLVAHDRLELVFETGIGDAQVMLRFSDDGGRTWSNEKWSGLGAVGKYAHRVIYNRLGSSRDRVYEYSISDPYRRTMISANLNEWG